jgi:hypothetical protein
VDVACVKVNGLRAEFNFTVDLSETFGGGVCFAQSLFGIGFREETLPLKIRPLHNIAVQ